MYFIHNKKTVVKLITQKFALRTILITLPHLSHWHPSSLLLINILIAQLGVFCHVRLLCLSAHTKRDGKKKKGYEGSLLFTPPHYLILNTYKKSFSRNLHFINV